MTDHPSNPPSQTKGEEIADRGLWLYPLGAVRDASVVSIAQLVDSALAAQEARHTESNLKMLCLLDEQTGKLREAESKLRQATEALRWMLMSADANWEMEPAGGHDWPQACAVARVVLAAIRSGPAQQAAWPQAEMLLSDVTKRDATEQAEPPRIPRIWNPVWTGPWPPEQETPKPDRNHCEHGTPYIGPACGACFQSAPPAHGGGD